MRTGQQCYLQYLQMKYSGSVTEGKQLLSRRNRNWSHSVEVMFYGNAHVDQVLEPVVSYVVALDTYFVCMPRGALRCKILYIILKKSDTEQYLMMVMKRARCMILNNPYWKVCASLDYAQHQALENNDIDLWQWPSQSPDIQHTQQIRDMFQRTH